MPHGKQLERMIQGAQHYAAADKSDPFTLARCMTHIRTGTASLLSNGEDGFYKADPYSEERYLPNGAAYSVTVYRNCQRP